MSTSLLPGAHNIVELNHPALHGQSLDDVDRRETATLHTKRVQIAGPLKRSPWAASHRLPGKPQLQSSSSCSCPSCASRRRVPRGTPPDTNLGKERW